MTIKKRTTSPRNLVPSEMDEQRELIKWIRYQPAIKRYVVKLNNEGRRTPAAGWHLKQLGMCVGASDLFLAYPVGVYHGLWLELKRNRKYSPSERETNTWVGQLGFQAEMRKVGYACAFCYGWKHASEIILQYLKGERIESVDPVAHFL